MIDTLMNFYSQTIENPSTRFFFYLITGITAAGLLTSFSSIRLFKNFATIAPSMAVTVGILGTFWGIAIGLVNFDVNHIDSAVPLLLDGLKIAFLTSIIGMVASVFLKIIQTIPVSKHQTSAVTPEDIHNILAASKIENHEDALKIRVALEGLRSAIADETDGSLVSQIQRLRSENRDGQKQLIEEFREFADHMVENNQKALIEALKDVIHDFNEKLTEQFGENFKELNAAVHKLVDWQENYRLHVEGLEKRLEQALSTIEQTRDAIQAVREHTAAIPTAIEPLSPMMQSLETQIKILDEHLKALAELREQALQAFPVVEENLVKMTTKLSGHVDQAIDRTNESLERHTTNFRTLEDGFNTLQQSANNAQQTFSDELHNALEAVNSQLTTTISKHADLIDQNAKTAQQSVETTWERTREGLDEQFNAFDEQMQQELSRTIEAMGQKLASLSEKFVADYQPLTERLRDLVQTSGSAGR